MNSRDVCVKKLLVKSSLCGGEPSLILYAEMPQANFPTNPEPPQPFVCDGSVFMY